MHNPRKQALVIGGTGMLADVALWLLAHGYRVSVIGRSKARLNQLLERTEQKEALHLIATDYHQTDALRAEIEQAKQAGGDFDLIVSWIHSSAPDALPAIVGGMTRDFRLVQILGSNHYDTKPRIDVPPFCFYQQVYLGFQLDGTSSRWLTNREIAQGVIAAIEQQQPEHTVGTFEPWERRPQ